MNIGLDVGYSATKAITGNRRVTFPSVVGTPPERAAVSLNGASTGIVFSEPATLAVGQYAVMQSRHLKRREDRGWIESDEWYNLALAAFTELTDATWSNLNVVTGLPVAFISDKDKVVQRLLGEHRVKRDGRDGQTLKVKDAKVIPQPFGALLALALDNNGKIADKRLASGRVAVIDVGGKTTNLLSVDRLTEVVRQTDSVPVGMWNVARSIRVWLSQNYPDLDPRDHDLMNAIKRRSIPCEGQTLDLGDVIDAALIPMSEEVIARAGQLWNGAGEMDAILITGGGSLLLGPAIQRHYRHSVVVDDPVYANALGFYRLAQRLGQ
jgi:plasmid segregation protein ParM